MKKLNVILSALCMSLMCSGCSFHPFSSEQGEVVIESYTYERLINLVKEKMDQIEFYNQDCNDTSGKTYRESYLSEIEPYLERYYSYMSEEQINDLLYHIENVFPSYEYRPSSSPRRYWDSYLTSIVKPDSDYGNGFCQMIKEVSPYIYKENDIYHFLIFSELIGDANLCSAIFSGNMDSIVNVITSETGYSDKDGVINFIKLFDQYNAIYADDNLYSDDEQKEKANICLNQMRDFISKLVLSKCEFNSDFKNSVFATALLNSSYFNKNDMKIIVVPGDPTFNLELVTDDYGIIDFNVPYYYLHSSVDIETILDTCSNNIINNNFSVKNYGREMELLSYIIGWNHVQYISDDSIPCHLKKERIVNALRDYFSTDTFNLFLVALADNNDLAIEKYMGIFKDRMMDGPITIDKLLEFNYLRDTISSHYFLFPFDTYDELDYTVEKGSLDDNGYFKENFYFTDSSYPIMEDFDEIMDYFHSQNFHYTELIEGEYTTRDWRTGERGCFAGSNSYSYKHLDYSDLEVLSQPLTIQNKVLEDGNRIWYYTIPTEFCEGECVSVYTNINNDRIVNPVIGLYTTMVDDDTNEACNVVIVSVGEEEPVIKGKVFAKEKYNKIEYQFAVLHQLILH